ncbi:MAG: hypothetical protein EH224_10740 [Calditrichaeota bacterium]|nr:MAG: hypothetical protein EH224_10740 [Calditrichota bacterium]
MGGIIGIDFINHENPLVEKLDFSFSDYGYKMVVVNTGGSHADLTEDYASIPAEMKKVAQYFGKSVCREITMGQVMNDLKRLTEKVGDRPVLRAMHFLEENGRVENQIKAIKENNFAEFLKLVQQSGDSSIKLLQNIYSIKYPSEQKISLALAVTEDFMKTHDGGACRIHGGGFAGTILTILPDHNVKDYQKCMGRIFGDNSVIVLGIRSNGIVSLNLS